MSKTALVPRNKALNLAVLYLQTLKQIISFFYVLDIETLTIKWSFSIIIWIPLFKSWYRVLLMKVLVFYISTILSRLWCTMVDGKIKLHCADLTKCTRSCLICGGTPTQLSQKAEEVKVKSDNYDPSVILMGLSPMHTWIKFFNCCVEFIFIHFKHTEWIPAK